MEDSPARDGTLPLSASWECGLKRIVEVTVRNNEVVELRETGPVTSIVRVHKPPVFLPPRFNDASVEAYVRGEVKMREYIVVILPYGAVLGEERSFWTEGEARYSHYKVREYHADMYSAGRVLMG